MNPLEVAYVIISPVRDEAAYIKLTLDSVVSQTVKPAQWIIVNDRSTDNTAEVVQQYVERYPWIKLVNLDNQGKRERGARIVRLFYVGLEHMDVDYEFIVKMDGDLSFQSDYFERLFERFAENPRLGIAGGECVAPHNGQWRLEKTRKDHVRGATKIYRRTCFEDIGGLPAVIGWDGIDEWRAQMKGWQTRGYGELIVRHHRPTGQTEGKLKGQILGGEIAYFLGYPLPVIIARSVYRSVVDRPLILTGLALLWGYFGSWLGRKPRFDDPELIAYIRHKQLRRLAFWRSQ